jgi:hypothetical protein
MDPYFSTRVLSDLAGTVSSAMAVTVTPPRGATAGCVGTQLLILTLRPHRLLILWMRRSSGQGLGRVR